MIYQDSLILITEDEVVFEHYFFPTGRPKAVRWKDIEWVEVKPSTLRNGRWRIHGTGNFRVWFPKDRQRPKRETIFLAKLKGRWMEIGFRVEHAEQVERVFRNKGLIKGD